MSGRDTSTSLNNDRARPGAFSNQLQRVLESGALYPGESEVAFSEFRKQVVNSLGGQEDFVDLLLINDIVDHAWEAIRLRKLKSSYLLRHIVQKIYETLEHISLETEDAVVLLQIQSNGQFKSIVEIEAHLVEVGTTYAAIEAETVMEKMAGLRDYDRMIATAEERRDYHLKELERRHGVRSRNREKVLDLPDNHYNVVEEAPSE